MLPPMKAAIKTATPKTTKPLLLMATTLTLRHATRDRSTCPEYDRLSSKGVKNDRDAKAQRRIRLFLRHASDRRLTLQRAALSRRVRRPRFERSWRTRITIPAKLSAAANLQQPHGIPRPPGAGIDWLISMMR